MNNNINDLANSSIRTCRVVVVIQECCSQKSLNCQNKLVTHSIHSIAQFDLPKDFLCRFMIYFFAVHLCVFPLHKAYCSLHILHIFLGVVLFLWIYFNIKNINCNSRISRKIFISSLRAKTLLFQ